MRLRPLPFAVPTALLLLAVTVTAAWGQSTSGSIEDGFRAGPEVIIDGELDHDVYLAGGRIQVDGVVRGDVVAAGGEVVVRGTVTGDVLAAAGAIRVPGTVAGTVRAAGGQVVVPGQLAGDLVVAGATITVGEDGEVGGDLAFAGGTVTNDGAVDGDVRGRAGRYTGRGTVAGAEQVAIGRADAAGFTARFAMILRRYVSLLLVAGLLLWIGHRPAEASMDRIRRRPLASVGVGVLGIVGASVVLFLAAVVVVGVTGLLALGELWPLAGLVATTGGVALIGGAVALIAVLGLLAPVVVGLWLGQLAVFDLHSWPRSVAAVALGLAAIVLVAQLPVIGAIVSGLVAAVGTGAVLLAGRNRWEPPAAAPATGP